ncbi:MAG: hypothetical protein ACI8RZ_006895, partial [Myxococcota bacterium]
QGIALTDPDDGRFLSDPREAYALVFPSPPSRRGWGSLKACLHM